MWLIRRISNSIRCHCFLLRLGAQSNIVSDNSDLGVINNNRVQSTLRCFLSRSSSSGPPKLFMGSRCLSSPFSTKGSCGEDALEGFSGLDTPSDIDETRADLDFEQQVSDGELKDRKKAAAQSELGFSHSNPDTNVEEAMKMANQEELMIYVRKLRKQRLFGKALKLMKQVEANNHLDLTEYYYSCRADLIAKVSDPHKAEKYIESRIPASIRGEVVYRTLLANFVVRNDFEQAERVFDKMRALGFPLTTFTCNQLLLLYKLSNRRRKFEGLLVLMEKENVKPDLFTYHLLIDVRGFAKNIEGMELVLESMKANGVEPDLGILSSAAIHYHCCGQHDKVKEILKEIEGRKLRVNCSVYTFLFRLYSIFGNADEVCRLWNECEASQQLHEYLAALAAWGRLRNVEKAEAVFGKIVEKWKDVTVKHYLMLLNIYADQRMFVKGEDLMMRMINDGITFAKFQWSTVVRLYAECGEVEKAIALLQQFPKLKKNKWVYNSFTAMLEKCAQNGDVHTAERIFDSLRQCAHFSPIRQYNLLLRAYGKAKKPADGLRERLEAEGISPEQVLASKLVKPEPIGFHVEM